MDISGGSDRSIVLRDVVSILEDITGDWDLDLSGGIGPETRLIADLGFESIDVVQFVVAIEQRFQRRDLPFEQLLMVACTPNERTQARTSRSLPAFVEE